MTKATTMRWTKHSKPSARSLPHPQEISRALHVVGHQAVSAQTAVEELDWLPEFNQTNNFRFGAVEIHISANLERKLTN